jgi:hypothetical protein
MLQLRQRVTARCHLGPLDEDDTRGYIEHRLKCAGATDKPTWDAGVFPMLHRHSGGIPRRINTLADRLMLAGFLADTTHLSEQMLAEVVGELEAESSANIRVLTESSDRWSGLPGRGPLGRVPVLSDEVDPDALPRVGDDESLSEMSLSNEEMSTRLLRIERSVLRQERLSEDILLALRKILESNRKPRGKSQAG